MEVKISLKASQLQLNGLKEFKDPQIKFVLNANPGMIYQDATYPLLFFVVLECSKDYGFKESGKYTYDEYMKMITADE